MGILKNKLCPPLLPYICSPIKKKKKKIKQLGEKRADEDAIEDAVERESQCMYIWYKKMDEYIYNMLKCMFESERMDFRMFVCKVCIMYVYSLCL
jgi:hypothetical protein